MKKIAIYLRLSLADSDLGEDGKNESNSIDNQRLLIRNYLESHEEMVGEVVEYKDDGYSGLNFDRPGFRLMIEDAKNGKIGTIIVKDLSRFGRDYIGVGDYLEQILPSLGVRLIAINSKYDSAEQGANILSLDVSISNMINNMYSKDLSKKLRSSFRTKWNEGQNPSGMAPFGYYIEPDDKNHQLRIDPESSPIVKRIFCLANEGNSSKKIAEKLNQENIPTPMVYNLKKGRKVVPKAIRNIDEQLWNTHKVCSIIKNYNYTGARVHGEKELLFIGGKKTKKTPKNNLVIVEKNHPAIISKEEFDNAQMIIRLKREPMNWNKHGDVFSKKLRCGCCGNVLQLSQGTSEFIYCQHAGDVGSKSQCNKDKFDRGLIITSVIHAIRKNIEELTEVKNNLFEKTNNQFAEYDKAVNELSVKLKTLSDDLARQYENYVCGNLQRDKFVEIKGKLMQERNEIESRLKIIEDEKSTSDSILFDLNRTVNMGQIFFSKDKIPEEIINLFLKEVLVHSQNKLEIFLNTTDLYEKALFEINQTKENALADD